MSALPTPSPTTLSGSCCFLSPMFGMHEDPLCLRCHSEKLPVTTFQYLQKTRLSLGVADLLQQENVKKSEFMISKYTCDGFDGFFYVIFLLIGLRYEGLNLLCSEESKRSLQQAQSKECKIFHSTSSLTVRRNILCMHNSIKIVGNFKPNSAS